MDILDEMAEYLHQHKEQFPPYPDNITVRVDYRDLTNWLARLATLLYAYTGDPDLARHLPEEE